MISLNAIKYTLQHLLNVALPTADNSSIEVLLADGYVYFSLFEIEISIPLFNATQFKLFLKGEAQISLINNFQNRYKIPVFFINNTELPFSIKGSNIIFSYDIITPSFALMSRLEEYSNPDNRDKHGRFLFSSSLSERYSIIDIPLVDEYAMFIRKALTEICKDKISIIPRKPNIIQTHDIDILQRFRTNVQALKSIFGRDLLINHSISDTKTSLSQYKSWKNSCYKDPYIKQIFDFQDIAKKQNRKVIFFFKAQTTGENDATYNIFDELTKNVICRILEAGGEVALHGSYESAISRNLLLTEKHRLADVAKISITTSRQHYLRSQISKQINSVEIWESAGIENDYTLGFPEHCGFKCGTCHPYPLYNLLEDRSSNIVEHPLIMMDGTIFDYMKLSVDKAKILIERLLQRVFAVEGDFVLLWHNHTTSRNYTRYYENLFVKFFI